MGFLPINIQNSSVKSIKIDVSSSGDTVIIAAIPSRIKIIAYSFQAIGTVNVKLTNGSGGSDLFGAFNLQAREGAANSIASPSFLFATTPNTPLVLNLSQAVQVVGYIAYFDDGV
jgi:hypothetical protein